jgi:ferritin-like protein
VACHNYSTASCRGGTVDFHNISACPPARLPANPINVDEMPKFLLAAE